MNRLGSMRPGQGIPKTGQSIPAPFKPIANGCDASGQLNRKATTIPPPVYRPQPVAPVVSARRPLANTIVSPPLHPTLQKNGGSVVSPFAVRPPSTYLTPVGNSAAIQPMRRHSRRPSNEPNRYSAPPQTFTNNFGVTYFNPGSAEITRVRIKTTGDTMKDINKAYETTGRGGPGSGETWHHMGDYDPTTQECTMILVATATHAALPHHGGAAMARAHYWDDPDKKVKYFGEGATWY